jgi:hypothetical protein
MNKIVFLQLSNKKTFLIFFEKKHLVFSVGADTTKTMNVQGFL